MLGQFVPKAGMSAIPCVIMAATLPKDVNYLDFNGKETADRSITITLLPNSSGLVMGKGMPTGILESQHPILFKYIEDKVQNDIDFFSSCSDAERTLPPTSFGDLVTSVPFKVRIPSVEYAKLTPKQIEAGEGYLKRNGEYVTASNRPMVIFQSDSNKIENVVNRMLRRMIRENAFIQHVTLNETEEVVEDGLGKGGNLPK